MFAVDCVDGKTNFSEQKLALYISVHNIFKFFITDENMVLLFAPLPVKVVVHTVNHQINPSLRITSSSDKPPPEKSFLQISPSSRISPHGALFVGSIIAE